MPLSRRQLLVGSAALQIWADLAAAQPTRFEVLDAATAAEVEALASQIIPSGDGPGAREAGVIWFIDRALATFESDKREPYRQGMESVQRKRRELFPGSTTIAALSGEQQIALMHAIESTPFFDLLRTHTVLGFLGSPTYGGNRGRVGWKHIGFESRMAWQPPFGYYDGKGE